MKLFLHWLRWDLRRFRVMLLIWTLLVLAHALVLGWLGWKMPMGGLRLDVYETATDSAMFLTGLVGLTGLLLLMYVLSTDPAGGMLSFWKVRPPSGYSIAGVKVVISVGAFLVLPAVIHGAVAWLAAPVSLAAPVNLNPMKVIVNFAALVLGFLFAAAAAAGSPLQVIVRLAGIYLVIMLGVILAGIGAQLGIEALEFQPGNMGQTIIWPWSPFLLCLAGMLLFMGARKSRQSPRKLPFLVSLAPMPVIALCLVPAPSGSRMGLEKQVSQLGDFIGVRLELREPPLSETLAKGGMEAKDPSVDFNLSMKSTGIPSLASARWVSLAITGPDGLETKPLGMVKDGRNSIPLSAESVIKIAPVNFRSKDLTRLSLAPCRLRGSVRLVLARRERAVISLQPDVITLSWFARHLVLQEAPFTQVKLASDFPIIHAWATDFPMVFQYSLEHLKTGNSIPMKFDRGNPGGPSHYLSRQQLLYLAIDRYAPELASAMAQQAERQNTLAEDWQITMEGTVPSAWVDVPVELDLVVMPPAWDQSGSVLPVLSGLKLDPAAALQERNRLIRYACVVADHFRRSGRGWEQATSDEEKTGRAAALDRLFAGIQSDQVEPLLEMLEREPPALLNQESLARDALRRRLNALLTTEKRNAIQRPPVLLDWLRDGSYGLAEDAKISSLQDLDDTALEERWKDARQRPRLDSSPLAEALRRGLPWAIPALAEVVEFLPDSDAMHDLESVVRRVVGERIPPGEAMAWLAANVHRLVWDAASRKWILPAPAPAAPAPQ
jgi:hypothetical protein